MFARTLKFIQGCISVKRLSFYARFFTDNLVHDPPLFSLWANLWPEVGVHSCWCWVGESTSSPLAAAGVLGGYGHLSGRCGGRSILSHIISLFYSVILFSDLLSALLSLGMIFAASVQLFKINLNLVHGERGLTKEVCLALPLFPPSPRNKVKGKTPCALIRNFKW